MSIRRRILRVLETLHLRVNKLEDNAEALKRIEVKLEQAITVSIEVREAVDTLRTRVIESDSRRGEELHRHQIEILGHEARLHKLERAAANGA